MFTFSQLFQYWELSFQFTIVGAILLACSFSFYFVTTMLRKQNDQGASTGDRFHYVQSFENVVERDGVDKAFDVHMYDRDHTLD